MYPTVVGGILALGQAAVLLHPGFRDKLGVFIGNAIAAFVVGFGIVRGPPVAQISVLVEFASLVVIAMDGLVPNHSTGSGVVDCVVLGGIEEWWLQNSSWKVDGVGLGIFVGIDCWRSHSPLGSIQRLTNLLELAVHFECRRALDVGQMIVSLDFES